MGWSFSSRGFILSPKTFCTIYSLFTKLEACIWWAIFWQFSLTTGIQTCKLCKQKLHLIQSAQTIRRNLQIIKINHLDCYHLRTPPGWTAELSLSPQLQARVSDLEDELELFRPNTRWTLACLLLQLQGHWCYNIVIMRVPPVILCQVPLLLLNDLFAWHHTLKIYYNNIFLADAIIWLIIWFSSSTIKAYFFSIV